MRKEIGFTCRCWAHAETKAKLPPRSTATSSLHRYLVLLPEDTQDAVLFPLSYLGLGRARSLAGDRVGARQAYEQFFDIWKDADADIFILKEAKAEYAELK